MNKITMIAITLLDYKNNTQHGAVLNAATGIACYNYDSQLLADKVIDTIISLTNEYSWEVVKITTYTTAGSTTITIDTPTSELIHAFIECMSK